MIKPTLATLPRLLSKRIAVRVTSNAERAVRDGHPWLFTDSITNQPIDGNVGDLAVVFDRKRRFLAIGLYEPDSPIRVRILHHGLPQQIDKAWFEARIAKTIAKRSALSSTLTNTSATTGYRLVHGENDGLPGLVVDRYDRTLVLKLYTAAWLPHLQSVHAALYTAVQPICPPQFVILRLNRSTEQAVNGICHAALPNRTLLYAENSAVIPKRVQFLENGLRFEADPVRGQKTGFFLDQRDNRARVEKLAAGKSVLNVFAYSGGFSLYAARGGAKMVDSLDLSRAALADAERNFTLNQTDPHVANCTHNILRGDAFQLMTTLHEQNRNYDMVIIDPPSFAKKKSETERALASYLRLTRLGLRLLAPNGILVQASCSSRVDAPSFFRGIHQAAKESKVSLREIERTAHPIDHPIGFAEGAYLKCLFAICRKK